MSATVKPTREQQAEQIAWLEAEIGRLRAALQQAGLQRIVDVEDALVRKEAEIERLKAALRPFAETRAMSLAEMKRYCAEARAALEGKP